ncbi:hypothetical protein ES705_41331 [subsurface metagenome]
MFSGGLAPFLDITLTRRLFRKPTFIILGGEKEEVGFSKVKVLAGLSDAGLKVLAKLSDAEIEASRGKNDKAIHSSALV